VCDFSGEHYVIMNVVVSQHNKPIEGIFILDNGDGMRFYEQQSASLKYKAGVGGHFLRWGTYKHNAKGDVEITYERHRHFFVACCHQQKDKVEILDANSRR
jgi:hypothetical protein